MYSSNKLMNSGATAQGDMLMLRVAAYTGFLPYI